MPYLTFPACTGAAGLRTSVSGHACICNIISVLVGHFVPQCSHFSCHLVIAANTRMKYEQVWCVWDGWTNTEPHLCYRLVSDWSDRCDITVSSVDLRGEAVTVRQTEGEAAVCLCVLWRWSLFTPTCRWVQTGERPTRRHEQSPEGSFKLWLSVMFYTDDRKYSTL